MRNKHNLLYWGIAVILGFCVAISVYLWSFQTPLLARREYAFALLLWFIINTACLSLAHAIFAPPSPRILTQSQA